MAEQSTEIALTAIRNSHRLAFALLFFLFSVSESTLIFICSILDCDILCVCVCGFVVYVAQLAREVLTILIRFPIILSHFRLKRFRLRPYFSSISSVHVVVREKTTEDPLFGSGHEHVHVYVCVSEAYLMPHLHTHTHSQRLISVISSGKWKEFRYLRLKIIFNGKQQSTSFNFMKCEIHVDVDDTTCTIAPSIGGLPHTAFTWSWLHFSFCDDTLHTRFYLQLLSSEIVITLRHRRRPWFRVVCGVLCFHYLVNRKTTFQCHKFVNWISKKSTINNVTSAVAATVCCLYVTEKRPTRRHNGNHLCSKRNEWKREQNVR